MAKLISWETFFKIADPTGKMNPEKFRHLVIAMMVRATKKGKADNASAAKPQ